jgi:hypothetical protein
MNNLTLMQQPLPLLRRTQLLPGESLPSLLERLVQLNYYPSTGILSKLCHARLDPPANKDSIYRPKYVQTFLQLAELVRVPVEELYNASDHRLAPTLTPPGQETTWMPWTDGAFKSVMARSLPQSHLRSSRAAQFCPLCLQNSPHHHLSWVPAASTICLDHLCLLIDECPQCKKRLSVTEIIKGSCKTCEMDLCMAPVVSVEDDTLGVLSQQMIQYWFLVSHHSDLTGGCNLPDHPPNVLYHLLKKLCRCLFAFRNDWPTLQPPLNGLSECIPADTHIQHRLAPDQAYRLYRAAFAGLLDWPLGLFRFLDTLRRGNPSDKSNHLEVLQRRWSRDIEQSSPFTFLLQSFIDYLLTREIPLSPSMVERFKEVPWFIERTGLWTDERTAQALGLSTHELRRLYPDGPMKDCLWPHSRPGKPFFHRDRVLAIQQNWKAGWSLSEACCWLGLDLVEGAQLVERGVLKLVSGLPEDGPDTWGLSRQSVEDFFEKVTNKLDVFLGHPRDLANLNETVDVTSPFGINRAALLQGVADGLLPAYKRRPEQERLGLLCFLDDMVSILPDMLYAQRGWVAGHKFAHEKGLSPRVVVVDWVDAGLIEPEAVFGVTAYFVRQRLEHLADRMQSPQ